MYERLEGFLRARQARYEIVEHPAAVTAQEQAAAAHIGGDAMTKVLVVKERDGYVMAVVPATCVLDLDRLKGLIGHGEIRLATVEEIGAVVPDCAAGAIPPFGGLYRVATYADGRLLAPGEIAMPGGDFATTIRMRSAEFQRLAEPIVGDFAAPESLAIPVRASGRRRRAPRRARSS